MTAEEIEDLIDTESEKLLALRKESCRLAQEIEALAFFDPARAGLVKRVGAVQDEIVQALDAIETLENELAEAEE